MRATLGRTVGLDGRTRRRFAAMRRVQDVALALFEARGYAAVTIEEIANAADVGPATVYRNFGTKERIVLWDDYEPDLLAQIAARLPGPLVEAVVEGLIAALGPIYARERERILRRSRLVFSIPAVASLAAADLQALRRRLADLFVRARVARAGVEADVAAAAVVATLEVSLSHWVDAAGRTPLAVIFRRSFACLAQVSPAARPKGA